MCSCLPFFRAKEQQVAIYNGLSFSIVVETCSNLSKPEEQNFTDDLWTKVSLDDWTGSCGNVNLGAS